MIFEQSGESREVSADWKLGNVVLIFKKGRKENPGNNRPSKIMIMENIILGGIILGGMTGKHLEINAVMGHRQHGSMRGKSCCGTRFPSTAG